MFGKNTITNQIVSEGSVLLVNSIFRTIQGEGPYAGMSAVFIRFSKCNLRCYFCDTEFETGFSQPIEQICHTVQQLINGTGIKLVVITGGEPFVQNFVPLVSALRRMGLVVQIETAGTLWVQAAFEREFEEGLAHAHVAIVVSPKTGRVNPKIAELASAWKYIVRAGEISPQDGLPVFATQTANRVAAKLARPPGDTTLDNVFVQPCDEHDPEKNLANMQECIKGATKYGYRLSLQIHKVLNLP